MVTIEEAQNIYDLLKGEKDDSTRNEKESIKTDRGN